MNLFFAPLACSLATRIALYEAGAEAHYTYVDLKTKQVEDGTDFYRINPLGQVPVLQIDDVFLTENTALLQYVAERFPEAELAPFSGIEHARLQQWLGFIGTELHKAIFVPLLDAKAVEQVKHYADEKVGLRLGLVERHLAEHDFLLDRFSIADIYLVTVLNWAATSGVDLKRWPVVRDYHHRLLKRPSIAKAVGEEWAMFQEEQARRTAA